jgi:hypothetical protein
MASNLSSFSAVKIRRAALIKEQIEDLQNELAQVLGAPAAPASRGRTSKPGLAPQAARPPVSSSREDGRPLLYKLLPIETRQETTRCKVCGKPAVAGDDYCYTCQ